MGQNNHLSNEHRRSKIPNWITESVWLEMWKTSNIYINSLYPPTLKNPYKEKDEERDAVFDSFIKKIDFRF